MISFNMCNTPSLLLFLDINTHGFMFRSLKNEILTVSRTVFMDFGYIVKLEDSYMLFIRFTLIKKIQDD
jgi:hypothetical protein